MCLAAPRNHSVGPWEKGRALPEEIVSLTSLKPLSGHMVGSFVRPFPSTAAVSPKLLPPLIPSRLPLVCPAPQPSRSIQRHLSRSEVTTSPSCLAPSEAPSCSEDSNRPPFPSRPALQALQPSSLQAHSLPLGPSQLLPRAVPPRPFPADPSSFLRRRSEQQRAPGGAGSPPIPPTSPPPTCTNSALHPCAKMSDF